MLFKNNDKVAIVVKPKTHNGEINSKDYFFSAEERVNIIEKALFGDLKLSKKKIKVLSFNTLTTSLCIKQNATIIFRGLRAVSDFEYEFQ